MVFHPNPLSLMESFTYTTTIAAVVALLALRILFSLFRQIIRSITSPLRDVPSPGSMPFFLSAVTLSLPVDQDARILQRDHVEKYGRVVNYKGRFNVSSFYHTVTYYLTPLNTTKSNHLWLSDPRAAHHILSRTAMYKKTHKSRWLLDSLLGPGEHVRLPCAVLA